MALTLTVPEPELPISLDEYIDYIRTQDLNDFDAFLAGAPMFKRLMANRTLLTDRLNTELSAWRNFQNQNNYSGQVLLLAANTDFIIRANVWQKPETYEDPRLSDDAVYSYLNVHDHNFNFMTGGYLGAGYDTVIWEWDGLERWPADGERVELRYLEQTSLPKGKVMVYRGSRDLHRQEHANEFSISLNLLVRPPAGARKQYRFDIETGTVMSAVAASVQSRETICDMVRFLWNDRTLDLLDELATKHTDPTVRGAALESMVVTGALDVDSAERRAAADGNHYVRHAFDRAAKKVGVHA